MTRIRTYIAVWIGLAGWWLMTGSPSVIAHQFSETDDVGVSLHISPRDSPVRGQPAIFLASIDFADAKKGQFPYMDCDCWLYVFDAGGEQILARGFVANNSSSAIDYEFSDSGTYRAELTGSPWEWVERPSFKPFNASFNFDVVEPKNPWLEVIPIAVALAAAVAAVYLIKRLW